MTFQREIMQQRAGDIKHSLSAVLGELGSLNVREVGHSHSRRFSVGHQFR